MLPYLRLRTENVQTNKIIKNEIYTTLSPWLRIMAAISIDDNKTIIDVRKESLLQWRVAKDQF